MTPDMPDHGALVAFASRHALVVNEAQEQFSSFLGEYGAWSFNTDDALLTLGDRSFRMQLLGSHSRSNDTFLWAWANPQFADEPDALVTHASRWLREHASHWPDLWQLKAPVFHVTDELRPQSALWPLQFAAFALLRPRALYSADYGEGRAFLTIHDDAVPWPRPNPMTLPRLLSEALQATDATPTALLETYAAWHGLPLEPIAEGLRLRFPGGSQLEVGLDAQGRVGGVRGSFAAEDAG